jgi:hypothetical protein
VTKRRAFCSSLAECVPFRHVRCSDLLACRFLRTPQPQSPHSLSFSGLYSNHGSSTKRLIYRASEADSATLGTTPAAPARPPQPLANLGPVLSLDRHSKARHAIDVRCARVKAPRTKGDSMLALRPNRVKPADCDSPLQTRAKEAHARWCAFPSTTHTVPARNEDTRSMYGATPSPILRPRTPPIATSCAVLDSLLDASNSHTRSATTGPWHETKRHSSSPTDMTRCAFCEGFVF